MYCLASQMDGLPVISLQTSEAVAFARAPIIDISNLEIMAFHCHGAHNKQQLLLMTKDIRQMAADCIIIDSEDELANPEDIIRLQKLIHENFSPISKPVISDIGRKLGIVDDYSINLETNRIQKLYVRGGLLRSWLGTNLIVDRTQIIDITPQKITVREATVKSPIMQSKPVPDTPS